MADDAADALLIRLWSALGSDRPGVDVEFTGAPYRLPSVFDVTGLAAATVACASSAIAELIAVTKDGARRTVTVDRRSASAAFRSEALLQPIGWTVPPAWDPIAGDYRTADGWIRLHTNYAYHRAAVEQVLGAVSAREEAAARAAAWAGEHLETAVLAAGGCAAVLHTAPEWALAGPGPQAPIQVESRAGAHAPADAVDPRRPLTGVRVVDLTRVIAGPIATRFLAAYGADVVRIDPPGFQEVPALLPITTAGKRSAALDLRRPEDRGRFEQLVQTADVLVCGLRTDALAGLGYSADVLHQLNPTLIDARLNAYGWSAPWYQRRGFDSLVQMSCGIAAAGAQAAGSDQPRPLPAQALDHGTGYLLAAAIVRALTRRRQDGTVSSIRASLLGTAQVLMDTVGPLDSGVAEPWSEADTEPIETAWGPARGVPVPGRVEGVPIRLDQPAGPLGRHDASWME